MMALDRCGAYYVGELPDRSPCIYVDAMLGWLARWLRVLGHDARYDPNVGDEELAATPCLLVTRDVGLFRRRGRNALLLVAEDHAAWIAAVSVVRGVPVEVDFSRTRCPLCNTPLVEVPREAVDVPPRVSSDRYWRCPRCSKAYWIGGHWRRIGEVLRRAGDMAASCRPRPLGGGRNAADHL